MKFLARGEAAFKDRKFLKQGATVYFLTKVFLIYYYMRFIDCSACSETTHFIIRNMVHAVLFSHFIYIGLLSAVRILTWTSFARAVILVANIFVNRALFITIPFTDFQIEIMSPALKSGAAFIVPAILNAAIVFVLVRALVKGRDLKKKKVADGADTACPFSRHTKSTA